MTPGPHEPPISPGSLYSSEEWTSVDRKSRDPALAPAAQSDQDARDRLLRARVSEDSRIINLSEVLHVAAALMDAETLAWLPADEARPATVVSSANLDENRCRQILRRLPVEMRTRSESLYVCNVPPGGELAATEALRNFLVVKSSAGRRAAWLLAINRRAGFSAHDARLLTPLLDLIDALEASACPDGIVPRPSIRPHHHLSIASQ